jgi:metal-sulfur cluster biosynthetic enzyme
MTHMTTIERPAVIERADLIARMHECLNGIVDPCSITAGAPAGLVDMGLVGRAELEDRDEGGVRAVIAIGITHPFCMMAGVFLNEVRTRIGGLDGIDEVAVSLDSDTVWTPDRMTADYRARLDAARAARRIPN